MRNLINNYDGPLALEIALLFYLGVFIAIIIKEFIKERRFKVYERNPGKAQNVQNRVQGKEEKRSQAPCTKFRGVQSGRGKTEIQ